MILAADRWPNNGALIADVAKLGYLNEDWLTLDATYGEGVFWRQFRPKRLVTLDIVPKLADITGDFTAMPFADGTFDAVVFDPPYKLNGRPDPEVDRRYGVHGKATVAQRMDLILTGAEECARVTAVRGHLLVKVMDQVVSGAVYWQTLAVIDDLWPMTLVDRFDFLVDPRKQPERTRKHKACKGVGCWDCVDGRVKSEQQHAARNYSTLLVFEKR